MWQRGYFLVDLAHLHLGQLLVDQLQAHLSLLHCVGEVLLCAEEGEEGLLVLGRLVGR
jgi:hypothetical protein